MALAVQVWYKTFITLLLQSRAEVGMPHTVTRCACAADPAHSHGPESGAGS